MRTIKKKKRKKYFYLSYQFCSSVLVSCNVWYLYSSITSDKAFIRWWLWVQAWFRGRSIITTNPECLPQQYLMTPPDFVALSSLYGIAIFMLMQLELYLGSFFMYFLLSDGESPRLVKKYIYIYKYIWYQLSL